MPLPSQTHGYLSPRPDFAAAGGPYDGPGLPLDIQEARDLAAKQLKIEIARALEEQILANKAKTAAEREKLKQDEFKEEEKLRREQFEIQKRFEEELAIQKASAEDNNRRELGKQIEEKKRIRDAEAEALRLAEVREEERLGNEQQRLLQQQQEEIRRERNANQNPTQAAVPSLKAVASGIMFAGRLTRPSAAVEREEIEEFDPPLQMSPKKPSFKSLATGVVAAGRLTRPAADQVKATLFDPIVERSTVDASISARSGWDMARYEELEREKEQAHEEAAAARRELLELRRYVHTKRQAVRTPTFRSTVHENHDDVLTNLSESMAANPVDSRINIDEGLRKWRSRGASQASSPKRNRLDQNGSRQALAGRNRHDVFAEDEDEVFRLDGTLESDSRFVFPDGTSFVPQGMRGDSENQSQPPANTDQPSSTKVSGGRYMSLSSSLSLAEADKRKLGKLKITAQENVDGSNSAVPEKEEESPATKSDFHLDVEALKRKNRRKLELLQSIDAGLCDYTGSVDDFLPEDLIDRMQAINSRPSSTGSSRPGTIHGDSRLFAMQRQLTPNLKFDDPRRPLSALAKSAAAELASFSREQTSRSSTSSLFKSPSGHVGMKTANHNYPSRESLFGMPVDYSEYGF